MNDYQFGFYDTGFLRHAIDQFPEATGFRMATMPIPQSPYEAKIAEAVIRHPMVSYAVVDKNKIALVIVEGVPGWLEIFTRLGYEVFSGDKTGKRLKTFHRPALLNAHFEPDELKVMVVDSAAYSRYSFDDDSIAERLCHPHVPLPICPYTSLTTPPTQKSIIMIGVFARS
jgi:hypothetical protein